MVHRAVPAGVNEAPELLGIEAALYKAEAAKRRQIFPVYGELNHSRFSGQTA